MKMAVIMTVCIGAVASNTYSMEEPRIHSQSLSALDEQRKAVRYTIEHNHIKDDFEIMKNSISLDRHQSIAELKAVWPRLDNLYMRWYTNLALSVEKKECQAQ